MSALVHPAKLISSMAPVLLEHIFTLRLVSKTTSFADLGTFVFIFVSTHNSFNIVSHLVVSNLNCCIGGLVIYGCLGRRQCCRLVESLPTLSMSAPPSQKNKNEKGQNCRTWSWCVTFYIFWRSFAGLFCFCSRGYDTFFYFIFNSKHATKWGATRYSAAATMLPKQHINPTKTGTAV